LERLSKSATEMAGSSESTSNRSKAPFCGSSVDMVCDFPDFELG
jgi:hypothetical protein